MKTYEIGKEKLENALPEKVVPMKAVNESLVDIETMVNVLKTEKALLMKTKSKYIYVHPRPSQAIAGLRKSSSKDPLSS